jgi:hypothetical protein
MTAPDRVSGGAVASSAGFPTQDGCLMRHVAARVPRIATDGSHGARLASRSVLRRKEIRSDAPSAFGARADGRGSSSGPSGPRRFAPPRPGRACRPPPVHAAAARRPIRDPSGRAGGRDNGRSASPPSTRARPSRPLGSRLGESPPPVVDRNAPSPAGERDSPSRRLLRSAGRPIAPRAALHVPQRVPPRGGAGGDLRRRPLASRLSPAW